MDYELNDISKVAYELYKQNWIDTHTTSEMRLDFIREWGEMEIQNDDEYSAYPYSEYKEDYGVGPRYDSYDDFLDSAYQDKDLMKKLLQSKSLIKAYLEDKELHKSDELELD